LFLFLIYSKLLVKFYLETYGCTLNRHDSELMRKLLIAAGHTESGADYADVVIINTCGVKDATEKRIIERLKRIKGPLVVCGCIATADERLVRRFAPQAVIVGTRGIGNIVNAVEDATAGRQTAYMKGGDKSGYEYDFVPPIGVIGVSDGCTGNCTYCFTKLARPGLMSMRTGEVLRRIRKADEANVKELRLTSQDMGAYGLDKGTTLADLLKMISGMDGLTLKIRIGMMNPKHLIEHMEIIDLIMENDVFYKFFHVPIQSGSDKVLGLMKRENSVEDYIEIAREIRKDGYANMMTDIIVGFPGEGEDEFRESIELIKKTKPDTTNVSKYSARPGTLAAGMKQIDRREINKRSGEMSELCNKISLERNERWVGKTCNTTIVEKMKTYAGRNDYYKQIVISGDSAGIGETIRVRLVEAGVAYIKGQNI